MERGPWLELTYNIGEKLKRLSYSAVSSSEASIFRVPNPLRQTNENAYEPRIISIGPYHHGKEHLRSMEVRKMHFLRRFLRSREMDVYRYVHLLYSMQEEIRKCYADPTVISGSDFLELMLLDGCFIIQLIREYQSPKREFLEEKANFQNITLESITRDLLLVENQLPFFVLSKLIQMNEENTEGEDVKDFILMALDFFSGMMPGPRIRRSSVISAENIKNLLGLVYDNLLASSEFVADRYSKKSGEWHSSNATELQEAGIKFKKTDQAKSLFNIKFENGATELQVAGIKFKKIDHVMSFFDINFSNGVLFIPAVRMNDDTHSILRNLIVHEQFHNNYSRPVTDYVTFMDSLINTGKDVELLRCSGIIANGFGDDEVVATIFNRLGQLFDISDEHLYSEIYLAVKKYRGKGWNAWMAKCDVWMANLRNTYFNTPWALISFLAAVILLILTALQTIYSLLSYYQR